MATIRPAPAWRAWRISMEIVAVVMLGSVALWILQLFGREDD
jgi:hypothetical protein